MHLGRDTVSLPRTPIVRCSGMELGWIVIVRVAELESAIQVYNRQINLGKVVAMIYVQ